MADKLSTSQTINCTFIMVRDNEANSRNLSFDIVDNPESAVIRQRAVNFRRNILNNYNAFIQPTGWRDDDNEESEWTTTNVKMKLITKTEVEFDIV